MSNWDTERQTGTYTTYTYTGYPYGIDPDHGDRTGHRNVVLVNASINLLTLLNHFLTSSYQPTYNDIRWSQWPFGLKHRSTAARFWSHEFQSRWGTNVPLLPFVVCCVAGGLWDKLITLSKEFYRVWWWCVCVCVCVWILYRNVCNDAAYELVGLLCHKK
jgi:hypothetical protein